MASNLDDPSTCSRAVHNVLCCGSRPQSMKLSTKHQTDVVLVGCGVPLRGMGWYHATQLLENACPSAKLVAVVEPWFMGAGASSPPGLEFKAWADSVTASHGVTFHASLRTVPGPAQVLTGAGSAPGHAPRMALVSGRTSDNPGLLSECISHGCNTIYLEKPGAPTVAELQAMRTEAAGAGVTVLMGYNKNVSKYVARVRDFASTAPAGSSVLFVSNNAYENSPESLGECFERNAEGMLKNMAIHELALLVSFYDVTVENIAEVVADKSFSSLQTLKGPGGKDWTDFDKIKFTITTKTGKTVSVAADRCGGTVSHAAVLDAGGEELFRYSMPDDEDEKHVAQLEKKFPGAMPYFFAQDKDYIKVKEKAAKFSATGAPAEGIATIDVAVETLRVAEYLTGTLRSQL